MTHEGLVLISEMQHLLRIISYTALDLSLCGSDWTQDDKKTKEQIFAITKQARAYLQREVNP